MEFFCNDPTAVVRAANVRATLDAFELHPDLGVELVQRRHLAVCDLTADNFVPLQRWLDALKEISERMGNLHLREVGAGIIENADFPPSLQTVESVLLSLDRSRAC